MRYIGKCTDDTILEVLFEDIADFQNVIEQSVSVSPSDFYALIEDKDRLSKILSERPNFYSYGHNTQRGIVWAFDNSLDFYYIWGENFNS